MADDVIKTRIETEYDTDPMEDAVAIQTKYYTTLLQTEEGANDAERAYNRLNNVLRETTSIQKDLAKQKVGAALKGSYTGDYSDFDTINKEMSQNQKKISGISSAMDILDPIAHPNTDNEDSVKLGTSIKNLTQSLSPVGEELTQIIGINPQLVSALGSVASAILGTLGPIAALIAVIKLAVEYVKQQTEWDKLNARMKAFHGTPEKALQAANKLGVEYDTDFGYLYTQLVGRYGDENAVNQALDVMKANEAYTGNSITEQMKTWVQAHSSGSIGGILEDSMMAGWQKELYEKVNNPRFKYSNSSIGGAIAAGNMVISDLEGRTGISRNEMMGIIDSITSIDRANNEMKNNLASAMTLSKIDGGNFQGNMLGNSIEGLGGSGNGRSIPVSVVNSVMLSSETLDILEDLREHQFVMQVNLQHNTPMFNQSNNFYNGSDMNTDLVFEKFKQDLESGAENGASIYNDGGIM